MQRFSPWLMAIFLLLCAALLAVVFLLLGLRKPDEGASAGLLGAAVVKGHHFDEGLGSLLPLVPEAGGIAPTPVVVASHGPGFRDLDWLESQDASAYTLQVLGSRSEEAVRRFVEEQTDPAQFSYFESREGGQPWFVVVYGRFNTREQALGVADSLELGVESRPFPKRFSAYVDALRLDAQPPALVPAAPTVVVPMPPTEPDSALPIPAPAD